MDNCKEHAHDRHGACLPEITDKETIALFKRMNARAAGRVKRAAKKAAE